MRKYFTPEVMGLVVAMVGYIHRFLLRSEIFSTLRKADPSLTSHVLNGIHCHPRNHGRYYCVGSKGKLRLFSVIIGMVTGYVISLLTGLMPSAHIQQILGKPLLAIPDITLLRWSFDVSLILPFVIASLCASVKTIGNLTTCQKINDANWKRPEITDIRKGLFADGLGMSISGMIGGMGQCHGFEQYRPLPGNGCNKPSNRFYNGRNPHWAGIFPAFRRDIRRDASAGYGCDTAFCHLFHNIYRFSDHDVTDDRFT